MTDDGKKRKEVAVDKLIVKSKKTMCILHFYSAVLPLLKEYVCLFQTKTTMVHKLSDKQVQLFHDFLACFVKPEVYADRSAKYLKDPERFNLKEKKHLLDRKEMFIGKSASSIIMASHKEDRTIKEFLQAVEEAYVKCAVHLQLKLPLDNQVLRCMSALDPTARGNSKSAQLLRKLPELVTNVLETDELDRYDLEVRQFQVCFSLPPSHDDDGCPVRLDKWWASVKQRGLFPALTKMAIALMSCFHGPAVEGSFNVMGDIIDQKSARMNVATFSAVQTVKYAMRAKEQTALEYFQRDDRLRDPVDARLCTNLRTSRKRYRQEQEVNKKALEEKKQKLEIKSKEELSKKQAKQIQAVAEKKVRLAHRLKMKERLEKLVKKRKSKAQKRQ